MTTKRIRNRRLLEQQQIPQGQVDGHQYQQGHNTVYRIDWQAPERGGAPLLYPASQPLPLVEYPTTTTQQQQQQPQLSTTNDMPSYIDALTPPLHELSLQDINPIPETIWSYTVCLGIGLLFWILYLLLPRGFRKQYCQANRKRFAKRTDQDMPPAGYWLPVHQAMSDIGDASFRSLSQQQKQQQQQQPRPTVIRMQNGGGPSTLPGGPPPLLPSSSNLSSMDGSYAGTPYSPRMAVSTPLQQQRAQARINHPPSPEHPALKKIPPNRIIAETMGRLQGRGIRLVAHGVHCDPKRVWIKLDEETKSVTWQTEFPRRVPNQSGQVSIVLMRGSVHRIALTNVLYIDVGKKTNALQRLDETKVPDSTCFSLLTQNGSLDLQANSKLERDSLVSCFSMILDEVHANQDWRALYETSPDPSLANSSSVGYNHGGTTPRPSNGGGGGGMVMTNHPGRGGTSSNYPNPSDLLVEV